MKRLVHFLYAAYDDFKNGIFALLFVDALLVFAALVEPGFTATRPPLYLCVLITLFDLLAVVSIGAFRYFGLKRDTKEEIKARNLLRLNFAKDYSLAFHALLVFTVIFIEGDTSTNPLVQLCWLSAAFAIVLTTMATALYALGASDESWLAGTAGHIGLPNWISLIRMALALLLPYIYLFAPFENRSTLVASFLLIAALATDALDGFVARTTGQVTKIGKALDALCDKVIFYPAAITFFLMAYAAPTSPTVLELTPEDRNFDLGLVIFRDVIFVLWFVFFYRGLKNGLGAGMFDKLRMTCLCAWLGFTAALAAAASSLLSLDGTVLYYVSSAADLALTCSAYLSVLSIPAGLYRWRQTLRTSS